MIVKNFEFKNIEKDKFNYFLFYGDNQAFKDELINLLAEKKKASKKKKTNWATLYNVQR